MSFEKKLKENAELACPHCEAWIDEKDLDEGHCDVCGENLEKQARYVKVEKILIELGEVAQKIREIFDSEIKSLYSDGMDEDALFLENMRKRVLGLLVESGTLETLTIMEDKKLMKLIMNSRKKGSKSSPYKPLVGQEGEK